MRLGVGHDAVLSAFLACSKCFATSSVRKSQLASLKTMYLKKSSDIPSGLAPPAFTVQRGSLPGSTPGKTSSRVRGFMTGA